MASGDSKNIGTYVYDPTIGQDSPQAHPHFRHLRRVTPRYSVTTGFHTEGLKPMIKESRTEYIGLPPRLTEYPRDTPDKTGTQLMQFLHRNGVLLLLTDALKKMYATYRSGGSPRRPTELFLEMVADLYPGHPTVPLLNKQVDKLKREVGVAYKDCWKLQQLLRAKYYSQAIQIYHHLMRSEFEADDVLDPPQPPAPPSTPLAPPLPHIWRPHERPKRRQHQIHREVSFAEQPHIRMYIPDMNDIVEQSLTHNMSNFDGSNTLPIQQN